MDLESLLPQVKSYVAEAPAPVLFEAIPDWNKAAPFAVTPLAQGEYNLNYLIQQRDVRWVLRANVASQLQLDAQIVYEYNALSLLTASGVTPLPYGVDDSREYLDYGVLAMEYLPGEPMDYRRDLEDAARLFSRVHAVEVPEEDNPLIVEKQPLTMTYEECARLLPVYLESELADPELRDYLAQVLAWAEEARHTERYFVEDPWPCIINTEVNSGNFIANREAGTLHLVDWEKPLYGDPSQDLSHFCAPMTTLWKTDYRMSAQTKEHFLNVYCSHTDDAHLRDTIHDRVRLRDPFNYLRGVSWSAMAYVTYQTGEHAVKNADTFHKITQYMDLKFQRGLFDPYLDA
ncbi:MAG: phosphotransferase family protein [Anaerolineae bacterium]